MLNRDHPHGSGRFRFHGRWPLALLALGASACLLACWAIIDPSIFDRSTMSTATGAARARFEAAQTFAARPLAAQTLAAQTRAARARAAGTGQAVVRVNQVGFPSGAAKTATAMAQAPLRGRAFGCSTRGAARCSQALRDATVAHGTHAGDTPTPWSSAPCKPPAFT
jgi:hypothetical protein